MAGEKLTRQELSWLLAQEARGAAKALRQATRLSLQPPGAVQISDPGGGPTAEGPTLDALRGGVPAELLVTGMPAGGVTIAGGAATGPGGATVPPQGQPSVAPAEVETTLDALDGAIDMLAQLQSSSKKARRGRIDLAALLVEVAPDARLAIEPGSGTEVFGDEQELTRMLHLLISQATSASGAGSSVPTVQIRRDDDHVRISVDLGPDASAGSSLERRWLGRMATRMGGRLELESGVESVLLPADGATDQREVAELRKELEQAQQLGEAYARELAGVFAAAGVPDTPTTVPPDGAAEARLDVLAAGARALHRYLRPLLEGLRSDAAAATTTLGAEASLSTHLGTRVARLSEVVGELRRLAECDVGALPETVDLRQVIEDAVGSVANRASRHGLEVQALLPDAPASVNVVAAPELLGRLLRALLDHAIAATPRDTAIIVSLEQAPAGGSTSSRATVAIVDGGPVVPASTASDLIHHRIDPSSLGRPGGIALLAASTLAERLGTDLTLEAAATPPPSLTPSDDAPMPEDLGEAGGRASTPPGGCVVRFSLVVAS